MLVAKPQTTRQLSPRVVHGAGNEHDATVMRGTVVRGKARARPKDAREPCRKASHCVQQDPPSGVAL